jgi:hypothetical protein
MQKFYAVLLSLILFVMFTAFGQGPAEDAYYSHQQILTIMDSLATAHPEICTKVDLGLSAGGRQISVLKISDNVLQNEAEPAILIEGGIHGDELVGPELVIRFARELCNNYQNNTAYANLINTRQIWLLPLINPDGRVNNERYNENGVDVNRDMGYMWGGEGNSTGAYSQPESKIIRNFLFGHPLSIYISFHGGTEMISFPWSYRADPTPENASNNFLANLYSTTSGYANLPYGQGFTTMYAINGSTKDIGYGTCGMISWSLEVSLEKQPPASQIQGYYLQNRPSMLEMIQQTGFGLQGVVTDSINGASVHAVISVNNLFPVYADTVNGYYHKYLMPGQYQVSVSANGYQSKTISNINIVSGAATDLNVQLAPLEQQGVYRLVSCIIPGNNFDDEGFTPAVLGTTDNVRYSLGKGGTVVVDMGAKILDGPGNDFQIIEGDATPEGYKAEAGYSPDGPWFLVGNGTGSGAFNLASAGIPYTRYIKITDDNNGSASGNDAGFDLDAISVLPQAPAVYLLMPSYSFVETSGNFNGIIEPGEEINVTAYVVNNGLLTASNPTGNLSSSTLVTLPSPNPLLGSIVYGQTIGIGYHVIVSPLAMNGNSFTVMLNMSTNNGAYTYAFPMLFSIGQQVEDWETGNFLHFPWATGGNVPWIITSSSPYEGSYCARSGVITDSQTTELTGTYNVLSPDSISFYRKVSSEDGYDFLRFYIDGVVKGQWSGSLGWARVAYPVTSGNHVFKWVYSKDQNSANGQDAAWIDYIDLPPVAVQSTAVSFTLPFQYYCVNGAPLILTGGTPAGGTYSGNGVSNGILTPQWSMTNQWINLIYTFTDTNGVAGSASTMLFMEICENIPKTENEISCNIYPNPNKGSFSLELSTGKAGSTDFSIINSLGQSVYQDSHTTSAGKSFKYIEIKNMLPGFYYLSIRKDNKTIIRKLVVQ